MSPNFFRYVFCQTKNIPVFPLTKTLEFMFSGKNTRPTPCGAGLVPYRDVSED